MVCPRPSYFVPHGDELLDAKTLAERIKRTPVYICAMKRDGFPMPGGRATVNQALHWLAENPHFRQNRKGKPNDRKRPARKNALS